MLDSLSVGTDEIKIFQAQASGARDTPHGISKQFGQEHVEPRKLIDLCGRGMRIPEEQVFQTAGKRQPEEGHLREPRCRPCTPDTDEGCVDAVKGCSRHQPDNVRGGVHGSATMNGGE
jgi:hypothetical protein